MVKTKNEHSVFVGIWSAFESFILKKGISRKYTKFYLMWVKKYVRYNNNEVPQDINDSELAGFRDFLTADRHTMSWQVDQALHAVTLLRNFLVRGAAQVSTGGISVKTEPSFKDSLPYNKTGEVTELLQRVRAEVRYLHYSIKTEQTYIQWITRFLTFNSGRLIDDLSARDIKDYLEYLAVKRGVSASTQNQALNALVFLFGKVLKKKPGDIGEFTRARKPVRLPLVLSKNEVTRLLKNLPDAYALMAGLLYGCGLRVMECVRLRVKDIDFDQSQIIVREGKGRAFSRDIL